MEDKLKSCPCCGGIARFWGPVNVEDSRVRCENCGLGTTWYPNKYGAMQAWNRRVGEKETYDDWNCQPGDE